MSVQSRRGGKRTGLFFGLAIFAALLFLPVPDGMKPQAWKVLAITALMASWWITEAIPIAATSLLPIVLLPALGVLPAREATAPYASDVIYLFMGGFFLAVTMQRWNLQRRIALNIIKVVGASPSKMVLGFMLATAFISMWVSNTATAMMMIPIGLAVVTEITGLTPEQIKARQNSSGSDTGDLNFGRALMLGIAYACSIGGISTIIASPPNAIVVGMVKSMYNYTITFVDWLIIGMPLAAVTLVAAWLLLTKFLFPARSLSRSDAHGIIVKEVEQLGPITRQEKAVAIVGACMASLWVIGDLVFKHIPALAFVSDSTVAIAGALLLFAWPLNLKKGEFLLDWSTAAKIPWDVVLLFGGGLALANAFNQTGLTHYVATQFHQLDGLHVYVIIALISLFTTTLTEITSNTAVASLLVPVMGAVAVAVGINPLGAMMTTGLAASFSFMMPVATPPNAIAYGSGCFTIRNMALAGIWMNLLTYVLLVAMICFAWPLLWGQNLFVTPQWALPQ
jgi:sodium-dependent dicarboxylate transporter 2/3/5